MKRYPQRFSRYHIEINRQGNSVIRDGFADDSVATSILVNDLEGARLKWVPARAQGYCSLWSRIRLAWAVFTGKADALFWPQQED